MEEEVYIDKIQNMDTYKIEDSKIELKKKGGGGFRGQDWSM